MRIKFKKTLSLLVAAAMTFTSLTGAVTATAEEEVERQQLEITDFQGSGGTTFTNKGSYFRLDFVPIPTNKSTALSDDQTQSILDAKPKTMVFTVDVTGEVTTPFQLEMYGTAGSGSNKWSCKGDRDTTNCSAVFPTVSGSGSYDIEITFDVEVTSFGSLTYLKSSEEAVNNSNVTLELTKISVNGNLKKENPITLSVPQTEIVEGQEEDVIATVMGNEAGLPVIYELFTVPGCLESEKVTTVTDDLTNDGNLIKGYTGAYVSGDGTTISRYLRARTEETAQYYASYSDVIVIKYRPASNQNHLNYLKYLAEPLCGDSGKALNYTEGSRAALKAVLEEIDQSIVSTSTQEEVDAAAERLQAAIDALVIQPASESDIKELNETLEKAKSLIESDYTADSWRASYIGQNISVAEAVLAQEVPPYYDVVSATNSLNNSLSKLEPAGTTKELAALASVIERAEGCEAGDYTSDSFSEMTKVLDAARSVPEGALKSVIDNARAALEEALAGMTAADTTEARAALAQEIANAEAIDAGNYTAESYAALTAAIAAANELAEDALNSEINAAAAAVRDAVAGLEVRPAETPAPTTEPTPAPTTEPTPAPTTTSTPAPTNTSTPVPTTANNAEKNKAAAKQAMKKAKITKLAAKSKAKKKVVVSWKKVSKAKGYEVQVSAKKNFKKVVFKKTTTKQKLTIAKKVKSGKTYFIRVRAYTTYKNAKGKTKKEYSSWSKKAVKVKVK